MSKFRVTRSYEYNVLCDVCGFKFKASELKYRWDGLLVCKEDWEIRHPSDFFRTRNDAHKLPFVRSDTPADPESTWVPLTTGNLSLTQLDGETGTTISFIGNSPTGYYRSDTTSGKTRAIFEIVFTKPSLFDNTKTYVVKEAQSTTQATSFTFTLPTTPTTGGTCTVINDRGEIVATATITAGNATVTLPDWNPKRGSIKFSSVYGT